MKILKLLEWAGFEEDGNDDIIEFKRGDLVLRPDRVSSQLYLILENVYVSTSLDDVLGISQHIIKVMHSGNLSRNWDGTGYVSFIINTENEHPTGIRNNEENFISFRKLDEREKELVKTALKKK